MAKFWTFGRQVMVLIFTVVKKTWNLRPGMLVPTLSDLRFLQPYKIQTQKIFWTSNHGS